jgi:hypothetical protein
MGPHPAAPGGGIALRPAGKGHFPRFFSMLLQNPRFRVYMYIEVPLTMNGTAGTVV